MPSAAKWEMRGCGDAVLCLHDSALITTIACSDAKQSNMKHVITIITSILILVLSAAPDANAQWMLTYGPNGIGPYVECLAVSDSNLFAGTVYYNNGHGKSGVFRSTDKGRSWIEIDSGMLLSGIISSDIYALVKSGANIYAGTGGGVFLSTNSGTSWTTASNGLPADTINGTIFYPKVSALGAIGTNLFASTYDDFFLSTNNGLSWTPSNIGFPKNTEAFGFVQCGTSLFAIPGNYDGIFFSTNNGTSWTATTLANYTNALVLSLAVSGTNLFAGTYKGGVFLSTDNGISWTAVNSGLTHTDVRSLLFVGTNLFAGTDSGGVFLSTNNGTAWTAVSAGLTDSNITCLAVCGTDLFAGTLGIGVWRRPLSEMIAPSAVEQAQPAIQSVIQNYPNPFSQLTTITFSAEEQGYAVVTVVDFLGSQVARIFSGEIGAGEHSFTWDASKMVPGIYECRIRMNGQGQNIQMALDR